MAVLDAPRPTVRRRDWSTVSDGALVRGATTGHDEAFAEIFSRYHGPLVRHCRATLLDDDLAQDAAQNALTAALRTLRCGGSRPQTLGPWLFRIAQREAVRLAVGRGEEAARRVADPGGTILAGVPAASDERVRDRLRDLLGDLARLPVRQRSALLLRELSGLDYAEIAVALQTSPGAARQSVLEARHALAESGDGRAESCTSVRALVDGGDRRRLRARRVRAHLDDCGGCRAFAARIDDRRGDLGLLFPLAPAALASSSGLFAALTGGGTVAGSGAAAASGWSLGLGGLGASGAAKCAAVCATAAIVGLGSLAQDRAHHAPPASGTVIAQAPAETATGPARAPQVKAPAGSSFARPREENVTATDRSSSRRDAERAAAHRATDPAPKGSGSAHEPTTAPAPKPNAPVSAPPAATVPTTSAAGVPAPAATTTPVTVSLPTGQRQGVALAIQQQADAAVQQALAVAKQSTQQSLAVTQNALTLAQQAVRAGVIGANAQLELVRKLLQP